MNLKKLDALLLSKFQSISDWMQDKIGVNNFIISKRVLELYIILGLATFLLEILLKKSFLVILLDIIGVFLISIAINELIKFSFKKCNASPNLQNPIVLDYAPFRLFALLLLSFALFDIWDCVTKIINPSPIIRTQNENVLVFIMSVKNIFPFFAIYFCSCTPKPPSKSRIKKLQEKIAEKIFSLGSVKLSPVVARSKK